MSKKLKIKINGRVSKGDIPDDVEELELECRVIKKEALEGCENLRSVKLINTKIIGECAFRSCKSLNKIELPDTLLTIGNNAFAQTGIRHLIIPPNVSDIGRSILDEYCEKCTIEVYLRKGALPIKRGVQPAPDGALLIVRSPDTDEILCQFILCGSPDNVSFTENGIDFTKYDRMFYHSSFDFFGILVPVEAARMRLRYPVGMDSERLEYLKDYVSRRTADELISMIHHSCVKVNFDEYPYYDDLKVKEIIELISHSVEQSKPEAAEILINTMYKKIDDINSINEILMEVTKDSARLGMTEMTAFLMQKLHENQTKM